MHLHSKVKSKRNKEDQDLSPGYYALNDDSDLVPIEFDFEAIQWGIAEVSRRPARGMYPRLTHK